MERDPFRILGVDRAATLEEIQAAYRVKAKKYHPDAGGDAWAFQEVQAAYEELVRTHEARHATAANDRQTMDGSGNAKDATPANRRISQADLSWLTAIALCLLAVIVCWVGLRTFLIYSSFVAFFGAVGCWVVAANAKQSDKRRGWQNVAGLLGVIFLGALFAAAAMREPPRSQVDGQDHFTALTDRPAKSSPSNSASSNLHLPMAVGKDTAKEPPTDRWPHPMIKLISWIYGEFGWPGVVAALGLGGWYLQTKKTRRGLS